MLVHVIHDPLQQLVGTIQHLDLVILGGEQKGLRRINLEMFLKIAEEDTKKISKNVFEHPIDLKQIHEMNDASDGWF